MTEKEGLTRAEAYCAAAEHCRFEVRGKLERMELEPDQVYAILEKLEKDGYIDENRYARAFVNDKLRFTKWGRMKIAAALREKRIPDSVAAAALDAVDECEYMDILRDVVRSKLRSVSAGTDSERRMKVMRSVCSRGFEMPLVSGILKIDLQPED